MKILHVISGLNIGGAETMLYKLLSSLDRERFQNHVVSLTDLGPMSASIRDLDVPLSALGIRRGSLDPRLVTRLVMEIRCSRPDIVQTWMYHADLVGGVAARLAGVPSVWNVRRADLAVHSLRITTLGAAIACARLSATLPARIICCSEAAARMHMAVGYDREKFEVIPNGFDLAAFHACPNARTEVRREIGMPRDAVLVGLAARYEPIKDHAGFVAAASRLARSCNDAHFLLWGEGVTSGNADLVHRISQAGLRDRFHLLGRRSDTARLLAALDLFGLTSRGEGFPNIVGEAMACGVPCVVTDVGDAALVVGETGIVVPPREPEAIAAGWRRLLELGVGERQALGRAARARIEECFSLPSVTARYASLYEKVHAGIYAERQRRGRLPEGAGEAPSGQ